MQEIPAGVTSDTLTTALSAGWGISIQEVTYLPIGAGGYHWSADGRWFLTVVSSPVTDALRTSLSLHRDAGLPFVLAPVPTLDGDVSLTLPDGRVLSVFPLVDGEAGDFGPYPSPALAAEVADLLAALHRATPAVRDLAPPPDLRLPGRAGLEAALHDLDSPRTAAPCSSTAWTAGPCSGAARDLLATHADAVREKLASLDALAATLDRSGWVVTHGEPHPGNVLLSPGGPLLIDWDTVRIAPPERDLWLLTSTPFAPAPDISDKTLQRYAEATGHRVSAPALSFYRQTWILADIAAYLADLRSPHAPGRDADDALHYLEENLTAPL